MHKNAIFKSLLVALLALPSLAGAETLWRGDFETGDISQWTRAQQIAPDRLQVVPSPTREGSFALRAEVIQGDNPIGASGNRNELVRMTNESEGDELWYGWSTMLPSDYPFFPTWQSLTQWHHSGSDGAPPVRFILGCSAADCGVGMPDTLFFIVNGRNVWTTKMDLGRWIDYTLHVKWSSDPSVGFVELWYDGELVVPKTQIATLYPGQTNYLKQGLYRDAATEPTQVVYHDGFTIGTSAADVAAFMSPGTPVASNPDEPAASDPTGSASQPFGSADSAGANLPMESSAAGCSVVQAGPAGAFLLFGLASLLVRRRSKR